MQNTQLSREEQHRLEVVSHMMKQFDAIDLNNDRIRYVWALKLVAEDVANLDDIDRKLGRLPSAIRPALMLRSQEVSVVQQALREYTASKETESSLKLLEKIDNFLEGEYD